VAKKLRNTKQDKKLGEILQTFKKKAPDVFLLVVNWRPGLSLDPRKLIDDKFA